MSLATVSRLNLYATTTDIVQRTVAGRGKVSQVGGLLSVFENALAYRERSPRFRGKLLRYLGRTSMLVPALPQCGH